MKINRCPKCWKESNVIRVKSITDYAVEIKCYDCGFSTGRCKTYDAAVKKWNTLTKEEVKNEKSQ